MKITCPNCETSYDIPEEKLGNSDRVVKCAKCRNNWQINLTTEATKSNDTIIQESQEEKQLVSSIEESSSLVVPVDNNEGLDENKNTTNIETASTGKKTKKKPKRLGKKDYKGFFQTILIKLRKVLRSKNKIESYLHYILDVLSARKARLTLTIVIWCTVLAISAGFILFRDSVVQKYPDLASVYKFMGFDMNLRGLQFEDIRTLVEFENHRPILVIEGVIVNLKNNVNYLPKLKFEIRGYNGEEVHSWYKTLEKKHIEPLGRLRFLSKLSSPPDAKEVNIHFAKREKSK